MVASSVSERDHSVETLLIILTCYIDKLNAAEVMYGRTLFLSSSSLVAVLGNSVC